MIFAGRVEHVVRICGYCGYKWDEAPLDAERDPQEPVIVTAIGGEFFARRGEAIVCTECQAQLIVAFVDKEGRRTLASVCEHKPECPHFTAPEEEIETWRIRRRAAPVCPHCGERMPAGEIHNVIECARRVAKERGKSDA